MVGRLRFSPRSFTSLLICLLLLAAIPLVYAVFEGDHAIRALSRQGVSAVEESVEATRLARQLVTHTTGMERLARQYLVLGDKRLLNDFIVVRERFQSTLQALSRLPLTTEQRSRIEDLEQNEQVLEEQLRKPDLSRLQRQELAEAFQTLSPLAERVLELAGTLTDAASKALSKMAEDASQRVRQQLLIMLALALVLGAGGALFITRPLKHLDAAIRRLGSGDTSTAISVSGPDDIKHLGERLEWLRHRLAELEAQQTRFLRHVSHELKTPLTALREGTALLADGTAGELTPRQANLVRILDQKSRDLQSMIHRLLDAQRTLDALGRLKLAPIMLAELIQHVANGHRLQANARNVGITMNLQPVEIQADADKIAVIIDNLLSNALRYSPENTQIALHLREQGKRVEIDVCDAGPGVPVERRDRIFDWFYHGDAPDSPNASKSSGLGLAIARELAQAHHGTLTVCDHTGPGACFRLTVPQNRA